MLTVVLVVLLCICVVVAICLTFSSNKHKLPPTFSKALPIIGQTLRLFTLADTSKLWEDLQRITEDAVRQGGVIHVKLLNKLFYVIVDCEDALTASKACVNKPFLYDFGKPWFGDGLVTASGEIWKHHRKIIQPAFGLSIVHGFLNIFNSQAKKLVSEMESHVEQGPFNHLEYLRKNSLETFCLSTFKMNIVEDEQCVKSYMDSIDISLNFLIGKFCTLWQYSDFLYWLSGLKKKQQEAVDQFNNLSNSILQRKKAEIKNALKNADNDIENTDKYKYKSFLDLLLELPADSTFTDKEIQDELNTIIGAGFETTSNQLMFTLLLLGSYPDVQEKLVEEVFNVLGPDRDVDKEDINKLVYTNAVLMESLRLFPTLPVVLRDVDADIKLKNYTMRAGSVCILMSLINKHDPTWGPEGDKFRPDRWLEDEDLRSKKEFAAFGLGRRSCIGRQYAMVTMKIILAHFFRQYKVTADVNQLKLKFDFVLRPITGHEIKINKRQQVRS